MDKTPEINPTPENIEIPENWKFLEGDKQTLKVAQIDLGERFLAYTLPDDPKVNKKLYKGEYRDYFFDSEGKRLQWRSHEGFDANIFLVGENFIHYNINELNARIEKLPDSKKISIYFREQEYDRYDRNQLLDLMRSDRLFTTRQGYIHYDISGLLDSIGLEELFTRDEKGNDISSPDLGFFRDNENDFRLRFYKAHHINKDFSYKKDTEKDNAVGIYILNPNQEEEKVFDVDWKIQRGESDEERTREYLVVSQIHIPTGIIKTIRAPLRLDMQKVEEAVYSKPPYSKERIGGKERLVVPWRNIDRIVGASLSYSYPPDKQS